MSLTIPQSPQKRHKQGEVDERGGIETCRVTFLAWEQMGIHFQTNQREVPLHIVRTENCVKNIFNSKLRK